MSFIDFMVLVFTVFGAIGVVSLTGIVTLSLVFKCADAIFKRWPRIEGFGGWK